jgi:hypothetical protein
MNMFTTRELCIFANAISLLTPSGRQTIPMADYLSEHPNFASSHIVPTAVISDDRVLYMGGMMPPVRQQICRLYS